MDGETTLYECENPMLVHVDEPSGAKIADNGATVLRKPNVVYKARADAEGLGAPVNINVVVPSAAPSSGLDSLTLLDEIDKLIDAHSTALREEHQAEIEQSDCTCGPVLRRVITSFVCLCVILVMCEMTQSYWAEFNHGERSLWIMFMFWTGTFLLAGTCWLSTESVYHWESCFKTQPSLWSGCKFRGAVLLLVAALPAQLCATMASYLARTEVFVGAYRPENFVAVNFVGQFVALYT